MRLPSWKFKNDETEIQEKLQQENAWPDMFANLQSAYAELTNAQFELERRASEIAETRDLVQQIISSMSEALFLTDRAGRVVRANPAAAALLGCTEEAILGRLLSVVCNNDEIPATPWKLMELANGARTITLEVEVRPPGGSVIPVSFSLTLMHDKQDKITGVLAVARDQRQQRHLIDSLVAARTRFQELLEFAPDAIVLANQAGQIVLVNSQTEKLFGYSREAMLGQNVELLVPERYRKNSANAATADAAAPAVPADNDEMREFLEQQPENRNALILRNVEEDAQQIEFYVVDARGREFLTEITQRPIVTEDGLLLMSVIRDISERQRIQKQLHQSEARYRAVAETAQDVIVTVDETGTLQFVNSAAAKVFGYKPEELLGKDVRNVLPGFTDGARQELTGVRKDGSNIQLELTASAFMQEGKRMCTAFIRDISERRHFEAKLNESEERYRNVAMTASEVIVTIDEAMTIQFANPAVTRVFGYTPEEMTSQPITLIVPPQFRDAHTAGMQRYLSTGEKKLNWNSSEVPGLHKDGHELQLELSFNEFQREGRRHFTGIIRDITDRKQMERQLQESEERYRNVALTTAEAIVTVDAAGMIQFANPAIHRVFGHEAQELLGRDVTELIPEYNEHIHKPESLPGATERGYAWKGVELRGLHKDGRDLALEVSFNEFARDGKKLRTGIIRDIGERKHAQERFARQTALRLALSDALADIETTPADLLQRAASSLATHLRAEVAHCWLRNEHTGQLELQAAAGAALLATGSVAEQGRPSQIAQTRQPLLDNSQTALFEQGNSDAAVIDLNAPHTAQSEQQLAEAAGLNAFAGYPLLAGERLLGVLAVYARQPLDEDVLSALGAAADAVVLGLERQHAHAERVRLQARETARATKHAGLRIEVSSALNQLDATLPVMLHGCAQAIVKHLDAALARIWLVNEAGEKLQLLASAGLLTQASEAQQFISVGASEIGLIAETKAPHLTSDVPNDPRMSDKEWAKREGIVAFAGYPLLSQGSLLGVLAIFAKQALEPDTLNALAAVADQVVLGVERRRAEEARAVLLVNEQAARREAEEASRLKDDFLAMISHELRAPLTAILGWAQMLRAGTLDRAAAERALSTIERNAKSQAHLVGDLLDASRIATGKLRLDKKPVELRALIDAAIDGVRPSVEAKHLRLQIVMEPWVGPFEGDAERMKQVVWNLLSNAVKFTPPGGLIEIRLEKLENKALLIVSDTGQGIEPEFLPYVFDRFRQSDTSTKRQHGGLGLGLAIVKSLVEMHGGVIYAYSAGKDQGTDFMITLPLTEPDAEAAAEELWTPNDETRELRGFGSLGGLRVLVVDDERDTREILAVMLGRFGAEVRTASFAAEGLETLQAWRPDLLVSDIGMPGEDGYALISKVRALSAEEGGQTPAIALTAFASSQDRQRALDAGFQVHLGKPVEPVELARLVARTLGRSEAGVKL